VPSRCAAGGDVAGPPWSGILALAVSVDPGAQGGEGGAGCGGVVAVEDGVCERGDDRADAVSRAEVAVAVGEVGVGCACQAGSQPPRRLRRLVVEGFGDAGEVGDQFAADGVVGVGVQVIEGEAGQAVDEVELVHGERLASVDACVGGGQALPGEVGCGVVEAGECAVVSAQGAGGVQHEGQRRSAVERVGVAADADRLAAGGSYPAVGGCFVAVSADGSLDVQQGDARRAASQGLRPGSPVG
jgi:hypothetical protein